MRVRAAVHQMQRVRVLIAIVQSVFSRAEQQRAAGAVPFHIGDLPAKKVANAVSAPTTKRRHPKTT